MAQRPRLDLRRLARDATNASGAPRGTLAPGGRPATGLMQAVRDNLDALLDLKASGRSWAAIAAGLTAQGFTTADGRAIDQRNLTGVVSSVRKQAGRHAARDALRRGRDDVSPAATAVDHVPPLVPGRPPAQPTLSPDLVTTSATSSPGAGRSEDERRRAALARAQTLLKKD